MKTYILQYRWGQHWFNYKTDEDFAVEFLTLSAARTVAADLMGNTSFPHQSQQWQVKDSTGAIHAVKEMALAA